jgi:hypothetical protein
MAAGKKRKSIAEAEPRQTSAGGRERPQRRAGAPPRGNVTAAAVVPAPTLSQAIRQVRPLARDAYARGHGQSQQLVHDFEAAIRQRPLASLLKAVGLGFLIGLIWR